MRVRVRPQFSAVDGNVVAHMYVFIYRVMLWYAAGGGAGGAGYAAMLICDCHRVLVAAYLCRQPFIQQISAIISSEYSSAAYAGLVCVCACLVNNCAI